MNKSKQIKKPFFSNSIVSTKTIFTSLFLITIVIIGFISQDIYEVKTQEYKDKIYQKADQDILTKFDVMLHEKFNTSLLVSSSLSKNIMIKESLKENNKDLLDMDKLLEEMRTKKEYVDIQAEVIDATGISLKRSWTDASGDDLVKENLYLEHLLKYPRVYTAIETTKYGMTITNKIPIFDENNIFLGYFGVNIHFDALVDLFSQKGNKIVILLNKRDSSKIQQELSYSKNFINDCYVVNSNADDYLLRVIKQNDINEFCNSENSHYIVHKNSDHLISKYDIKNAENMTIAMAIIFRSLDEIDYQDLDFMQKAHIIGTIIIFLLIFFFIKYLYMARVFKILKLENEELIIVNEDLKEKTDELDFNDKKLDNLFNMQPNLMFMHNGKELTKANNRFMGFFNRFGTYEGFKKKHKCVSELFEKYEAPNYIWEQYIEGEFWIDYLLQNPRKLYKVVMSINGDPHHFIIKFNEMEYSQHVTERIIIVALVDMTQDLVNYKSSKETAALLKDIQVNKNLELKEEMQNTDISYEIVEEFKKSIQELTLQNSVDIKVEAVDASLISKEKVVKVDGILHFNDVETTWNFFIPSMASYKILNLISEDKFELKNEINKDVLDTAKELVYTLSINLCESINKKNFHDLQNGKYIQSEIAEITKKELLKLENFYKINIICDNETIEVYTQLDKDLIPFVRMIVENKEIIPYIVKEDTPQKAVETPIVEDIAEKKETLIQKTEEVKEPIKVEETIQKPKTIEKKTTQKPKVEELDPYTVIQKSLEKTLSETLDTAIQTVLIKQLDNRIIQNKNGILFETSFITNDGKNLESQFFIPATTLSTIFNTMVEDIDGEIVETIDDGLRDISKQILVSLRKNIILNSDKKVEFKINKDHIVDTISNIKLYKIYDLGVVVKNDKLPIYLLVKGV